MTSLIPKSDPSVVDVNFTDEMFLVTLDDNRVLQIPLAWYPRLLHGSSSERQNWQLLGDGDGIEWTDLDEHISVEGLIAKRRSGESNRSLNRWLANRPAHTPTEHTGNPVDSTAADQEQQFQHVKAELALEVTDFRKRPITP
ncbi:MAG: DUF2442 domain-containing protein [Gloeomargaritaceae cyanobacterium C42_A2020_066]|nr:DUF2442 domain-containing protein [Gloeomargaritaceae cyanobacterium C42_A2020_066]